MRTSAPVEIDPDHSATVGGVVVRRALPRRGRRTIGAWCFVDHFGPDPMPPGNGLLVGPHPHIGLQTVTWLLAGEVLHTDSLGSEQTIRPGQLNVMTAGDGIAHSEQTPAGFRGNTHGVQLWVAQPDSTRHYEPAFEHHGELPVVGLPTGSATILNGKMAGAGPPSPARADTALVGAQLDLGPGPARIDLRADFEHGLIVLDGAALVDDHPLKPGALATLTAGWDQVTIDVQTEARLLLIGGTPFPEDIMMWWNFVARTRAEIDLARVDWEAHNDRFGPVDSSLEIIPAPPTPWGTP